MQPFIRFFADNSFMGQGTKDAAYAQVVGSWKADSQSAFRALSLAGKCKHLVRQSLMYNFVNRVYHKDPFFLFTEYKDQLNQWLNDINGNTGENNPMVTIAIQVVRMLLNEKEENTFLYPSLTEMEVFLDPSSDTEPIPRIADKGFYIPYMHFVIKSSCVKAINSHSKYVKEDEFSYPLAALPKLSFFDNMVFVEYQKVPEFKFDASLLNKVGEEHPSLHGSFYEYLLCVDWSEMNLSQVLAYVSNYALVLDPNAIPENNVGMVFNKLWRTIFNYVGNIPANIVCDSWHLNQFITFIILLRKIKKVEVDDPQIIASFISNGGGSNLTKDEKDLVNYLNKVNTNSEHSMEEYHAFSRSIFGTFKELHPSQGNN